MLRGVRDGSDGQTQPPFLQMMMMRKGERKRNGQSIYQSLLKTPQVCHIDQKGS